MNKYKTHSHRNFVAHIAFNITFIFEKFSTFPAVVSHRIDISAANKSIERERKRKEKVAATVEAKQQYDILSPEAGSMRNITV
jgi:hypothetical protein